VLVEERTALLTQLFVRRVLLTNGGKESHSALVRQEVQEPHEFPMQAAGGRSGSRRDVEGGEVCGLDHLYLVAPDLCTFMWLRAPVSNASLSNQCVGTVHPRFRPLMLPPLAPS